MIDYFHKLNEWYKTQCDGEWEHTYGIDIDSLDNPGWRITIDIQHLRDHFDKFTPIIKEERDGWVNIARYQILFGNACSKSSALQNI